LPVIPNKVSMALELSKKSKGLKNEKIILVNTQPSLLLCGGETTSMSLVRALARAVSTAGRPSACRCMCTAPTNIRKDGSDPEIGPDEAYPAWVADLGTVQLSMGEMEKRGYHNLTWQEQKRYHQLIRREEIKVSNSMRAKK